MDGPAPVEADAAAGRGEWEGAPTAQWAERWRIPLFEAHTRVTSTNDRARALAIGGAASFSVVTADEQTRGRGRLGRAWSSPAGLGLGLSVVLQTRGPHEHPTVPILAGVATARAVEEVCPGLVVGIKWPNDLLVGTRKVAGILGESWDAAGARGAGVVIGVGINVAQKSEDFPEEIRQEAGSLATAGAAVSRSDLAGALIAHMRALLEPEPARLGGGLADELARRDALAGRTVALEGGERGTARGIDPTGALLVEDGAGRVRRLFSGSVRPLDGITLERLAESEE